MYVHLDAQMRCCVPNQRIQSSRLRIYRNRPFSRNLPRGWVLGAVALTKATCTQERVGSCPSAKPGSTRAASSRLPPPGAPSVAAERASSAARRRENDHSSGEIERFRM